MMSKATDAYVQAIRTRLDRLESSAPSLDAAAALMADAALNGRKLFVFGASHAGILTEELCYRAGGLAIVNPLFCPALMLNVRPLPLTSALENVEGLGRELVQASPIAAGDVMLIHSVSGRNAVPLDVALSARGPCHCHYQPGDRRTGQPAPRVGQAIMRGGGGGYR